MSKRIRMTHDVGGQDFGENILSVAINGGDFTTIKEALEYLQSSGTADGSGAGYIIDSAANWEVDFFTGGSITIDGAEAGTYIVTSNTETQINISGLSNDPGNANYTVWVASSDKQYQIKVFPGLYVEDNSSAPLRLLDDVIIAADMPGVDNTTNIQPLDSSKTLFRSSINGLGGLRGVCISNVTGLTAYGMLVDSGEENYLYSVQFQSCSNGLGVSGSGIFSFADYTEFYDCGVGLAVTNQAEAWWTLGYAEKVSSGTTVVYCDGIGSICKLTTVDIYGAFTNGIYVDHGAYVDFNGLHIGDVVNNLRYGNQGGSIKGSAIYMEGSSTWHILDETTTLPYKAVARVNGIVDASKISTSNPSSEIYYYGHNAETDFEGFVVGGRFSSPWAEALYVSKPGIASGDYITIKEAVNSIMDASASKPYCVFVYPGVYLEDNPITLKPYVSLYAMAGAPATKIIANNINSNLVVLDAGGEIRGVTVFGATGAAGVYYSGGAIAAAILDVLMDNCLTGLKVTGPGSNIYASNVIFSGTMDNPIAIENGSNMFLRMANIFSTGVDKAIKIDASTLDGVGIFIQTNAEDGIFLDNGAIIDIRDASVQYSNNALHLSSNGNNIARLFSFQIDNSTTYDMLSDSANNIIVMQGGKADANKIKTSGCSINTNYFYDKQWESSQVIEGKLSVGSKQTPTNFITGGGSFYIQEMTVMTNTNGEVGTWNDITSNLTNQDAVGTDLFAGTGADNCMYVGVTNKFYGIRYLIINAINLGTGSLVWEYWNGAAWTTYASMASKREPQYTPYANSFAAVTWIQERMYTGIGADWATKTLNSIADKYWIRCRIVSSITTIPKADVMDIQPDSMVIRFDGTRHYFGANRFVTNLPLKLYAKPNKALQAENPASLSIANAINIAETNLTFADGEVDDVVFYVDKFPFGIDYSYPMTLEITWCTAATTGNIEWSVEYAVVRPTTAILDGTIPKQIISGVFAVGATAWQTQKSQLQIYIDPTNIQIGDVFYTRLLRDARSTNTDDTMVGDAVVVRFEVKQMVWSDTNIDYS